MIYTSCATNDRLKSTLHTGRKPKPESKNSRQTSELPLPIHKNLREVATSAKRQKLSKTYGTQIVLQPRQHKNKRTKKTKIHVNTQRSPRSFEKKRSPRKPLHPTYRSASTQTSNQCRSFPRLCSPRAAGRQRRTSRRRWPSALPAGGRPSFRPSRPSRPYPRTALSTPGCRSSATPPRSGW